MTYRILVAMLLLIFFGRTRAQDTLVYVNGERIIGYVDEIGVDLVKYRTSSGGNSVLIVAEKRDLARIRLSGGQQFIFNDASTDIPATEAFMARKQQIMLDVLAPALDHFTISYERLIGRRMSLKCGLGYIGIWDRDGNSQGELNKGFVARTGSKFILPNSSRHSRSARADHPLAGWYLEPELMFSYWAEHDQYYYSSYPSYGPPLVKKTFFSSAALNLVVGTQLLIGERVTFDIHGGLGYGIEWQNGHPTGSNDRYYAFKEYAYSHAFFGRNSPLCVSGGLQFGYLF